MRLPFVEEGASYPAVAPRGNRLAFTRLLREINIWALDVDRLGVAEGPASRVFDSSKSEICPQFSPDGRRVAFESNRSGTDEIWVCQADGTQCVQLTSFQGQHAGSPSWSPRGDVIAFGLFGREKGIYVVSADGGRPQRLSDKGQITRWSPLGDRIYFADFLDLFSMPGSGGAATQLTHTGGLVSQVVGDEIYYSGHPGGGSTYLRKMAAHGGPATDVLPPGELSGRNFEVVDKGIWYLTSYTKQNGSHVKFYDFASRTSRDIYRIDKPVFAGLTVSKAFPDGHQRLLFTQIDRDGSDLMLVEHFR